MTPPASPQRVFLGWSHPFLPAAVAWLRETVGEELADWTLVVPGRRAGRRLLELLAQARSPASGPLEPPAILTLGGLAESLVGGGVASRILQLVARVEVLRRAPAELLAALMPRPPAAEDLDGWVGLAETLDALEEELAAEGLDLSAACDQLGPELESSELARWQALHELGVRYESELRRLETRSPHRARLEAMASRVASGQTVAGRVVLVGVAELGRLFRGLLAAHDVVALVQAPPELARSFDAWGSPRPQAWEEFRLDLESVDLRVVDRPRDQVLTAASVVADACTSPNEGDPLFEPREVTVGVGDSTTVRAIEEGLELHGIASHSPFGIPFSRSRPAQLLVGLARLSSGRRAADLATLLRHPEVGERLAQWTPAAVGEDEGGNEGRRAGDRRLEAAIERGDWLTLFDRYSSLTLIRRLEPPYPGDPAAAAAVGELVDRLCAPLAAESRQLNAWAGPLLELLRDYYGGLTLELDRPGPAELAAALELLATTLGELSELPEDVTPPLEAEQAITLLLARLARERLAPPPQRPVHSEPRAEAGEHLGSEVEVLGWLELALDDAPAMVVTGLNEGLVPESVCGDLFLPDGARRRLGLLDNRRRYARDLFALATLVNGREHLTLIAGRRSADDEPLVPSRLLLNGDEAELAARVERFYAESGGGVDSWRRRSAAVSSLGPPPPEPPTVPITELPVTAFRDYLACPYRFYLKRVRRLRPQRDLPRELDPPAFGSLAHQVLRALALGSLAECEDGGRIAAELSEHLWAEAKDRLGNRPPVTALVQLEQLRRRLEVFAHWQAEQRRGGWSIVGEHLERELRYPLEVDGEPFSVVGRIDRIDRHPELGYRLIDYKTGNRVAPPEESHRQPEATSPGAAAGWSDLQLPLYRLLAEGLELSGSVELAFVALPTDLGAPTYLAAGWSESELEEAWEVARGVVRRVRAGVFWPPSPAPGFDDGMAAICAGPASGGGA